ncbi:serine/threonine-protein kinase [Streptomyces sp. UNOC14_S4]|uniref:serine/threonine-protein kinase n=1 Tax=Streptomyces sp. UNOC14_S4 TaxID=2872340 RepID=UPI001E4F893A|nr:serine/threonine-protein kinase [Streptomyces sp. UNOC14_S4]MCC3767089.1 protein kinase [Streptomyces sp. UNOC14_S4]
MSGDSGTGQAGRDGRGERPVAGRYRLLDRLGQGGMGVVWRARDEVLDREVAVKEVRAPAGLLEHEVRQLYARLEREGRAAARISHRNVIGVYDVVTEDGRPWIVMELVRGLSFAEVLEAQGAVTPARAAHIGAETAAALRAAHQVGVLHRDVKPGNVLLADDGRVVLSDFGIATVAGSSALTRTGELVGSPEYLAPERALGQPPGPASDLWSLGVMLYAAVEGFSPFRQETPLGTIRAVVDQELPPPRAAGTLAPVLDGLLRKDPARRLGAAEAERMLRTVAAQGAGASRMPQGPDLAHAPTVPAGPAATDGPAAPRTPPPGFGPPPGGPAPEPEPGPEGEGRRIATVLVAAALAAALLVGGLVWALTQNSGDSGGTAAQGGTASPGGKDAGAPPATGSGNSGSAASPGSPGSSADYGVRVAVTAQRDQYTGTCPPAEAAAPAFRAVLAVGRTPVDVVYRWVTGSGKVTDGGWRTLHFTSGKAQTVGHTESDRGPSDAGDDWIAVEVRSPQQVTSSHVSFTVRCGKGPTGGTSPSSGPTGATGHASPPGRSPSGGPTYGGGDRGGAYGGTYGGAHRGTYGPGSGG